MEQHSPVAEFLCSNSDAHMANFLDGGYKEFLSIFQSLLAGFEQHHVRLETVTVDTVDWLDLDEKISTFWRRIMAKERERRERLGMQASDRR